jgi:hypothetical protein
VYRTGAANSNKINVISIYPDTLCWIRDVPYSYNEPLTRRYFSHKAFNDYPVVGVSWEQANAYCQWLSNETKLSCRLPNILEFLYAYMPDESKAMTTVKNGKSIKRAQQSVTFPWKADSKLEVMDKNGNYLANFGPIIDEYGAVLKGYASDGAYYTTKAGSYPATSNGVYDLAGNVAEWIDHSLSADLLLNNLYEAKREAEKKEYNPPALDENGKILYNKVALNFDSIAYTLFDIYRYPEAKEEWDRMGKPKNIEKTEELMNYMAYTIYQVVKQTQNILNSHSMLKKMNDPKAVMGGSWKDGAALMQFGEIQAFAASAKHCMIGFRVAIDRAGW